MQTQNHQLEALQDIRRLMKRSSKFISLSGLSGISAGLWALIGSYIAFNWIQDYYHQYNQVGYTGLAFQKLKTNLLLLATAVFCAALLTAYFFTWRRASKNNLPVWDHTSKQLFINIMIPLVTGGFLILALLRYNDWRFVAPLSLIFYGLALVNGSKYTLSDMRYLGIMEIIVGLIATQYIGYGLYFWALGFGVLHIIYGFIMWWKYERTNDATLKTYA